MTDTPRSIAALQALFADNTSGNISAQDLRDFLVTCVNYLDGVVVAPTDPEVVPLMIRQPVGSQVSGVDSIEIFDEDDALVYAVDMDGMLSIFANDGGITLEKLTGSGQAAFQAGQVGVSTTVDTDVTAIYVLNGGNLVFRVSKTGVVFLRGGVPADGDLNAGDLTLWFDPTNGAAKLMIKAKSTNGTVVTGNVALA